MKPYSCPECRAIHQEFQEAFAAIKERMSGQGGMPDDLAGWIEQMDQDECARMRETSTVWKTWRRLQEHRALTGHHISLLPGPPDGIADLN
jgi:hypothetical protein